MKNKIKLNSVSIFICFVLFIVLSFWLYNSSYISIEKYNKFICQKQIEAVQKENNITKIFLKNSPRTYVLKEEPAAAVPVTPTDTKVPSVMSHNFKSIIALFSSLAVISFGILMFTLLLKKKKNKPLESASVETINTPLDPTDIEINNDKPIELPCNINDLDSTINDLDSTCPDAIKDIFLEYINYFNKKSVFEPNHYKGLVVIGDNPDKANDIITAASALCNTKLIKIKMRSFLDVLYFRFCLLKSVFLKKIFFYIDCSCPKYLKYISCQFEKNRHNKLAIFFSYRDPQKDYCDITKNFPDIKKICIPRPYNKEREALCRASINNSSLEPNVISDLLFGLAEDQIKKVIDLANIKTANILLEQFSHRDYLSLFTEIESDFQYGFKIIDNNMKLRLAAREVGRLFILMNFFEFKNAFPISIFSEVNDIVCMEIILKDPLTFVKSFIGGEVCKNIVCESESKSFLEKTNFVQNIFDKYLGSSLVENNQALVSEVEELLTLYADDLTSLSLCLAEKEFLTKSDVLSLLKNILKLDIKPKQKVESKPPKNISSNVILEKKEKAETPLKIESVMEKPEIKEPEIPEINIPELDIPELDIPEPDENNNDISDSNDFPEPDDIQCDDIPTDAPLLSDEDDSLEPPPPDFSDSADIDIPSNKTPPKDFSGNKTQPKDIRPEKVFQTSSDDKRIEAMLTKSSSYKKKKKRPVEEDY